MNDDERDVCLMLECMPSCTMLGLVGDRLVLGVYPDPSDSQRWRFDVIGFELHEDGIDGQPCWTTDHSSMSVTHKQIVRILPQFTLRAKRWVRLPHDPDGSPFDGNDPNSVLIDFYIKEQSKVSA